MCQFLSSSIPVLVIDLLMGFGIWLSRRDTGFKVNNCSFDIDMKTENYGKAGHYSKKAAVINWHKEHVMFVRWCMQRPLAIHPLNTLIYNTALFYWLIICWCNFLNGSVTFRENTICLQTSLLFSVSCCDLLKGIDHNITILHRSNTFIK